MLIAIGYWLVGDFWGGREGGKEGESWLLVGGTNMDGPRLDQGVSDSGPEGAAEQDDMGGMGNG